MSKIARWRLVPTHNRSHLVSRSCHFGLDLVSILHMHSARKLWFQKETFWVATSFPLSSFSLFFFKYISLLSRFTGGVAINYVNSPPISFPFYYIYVTCSEWSHPSLPVSWLLQKPADWLTRVRSHVDSDVVQGKNDDWRRRRRRRRSGWGIEWRYNPGFSSSIKHHFIPNWVCRFLSFLFLSLSLPTLVIAPFPQSLSRCVILVRELLTDWWRTRR